MASSALATGLRLISRITSPGCKPAAAAGEPGSTFTTSAPTRTWLGRFSGGRFRGDFTDERPSVCGQLEFLRQIGCKGLNPHAKVPAGDFALGHDTLHDIPRQIDRHGEADALIATGAAQDGGADADQPP